MFGAFIIGCGTTHLMEVITNYLPVYRFSGLIKLLTAGVSLATAAALIPLVPKALALRSPTELEQQIAERKQAEAALQRSEERFRLLVDGVKDFAIFMLDPDGRIASWNAGAERIKGFRAEEIIGQHFSRFYTPEDLRDGEADRALRLALSYGRYESEGWRVRKNGTRFWANTVLTALRDEAGELKGFAKVTQDITERKQAHDRLQRSNAELEQFASVASHDLQEPLRKIQTLGDRLQAKCGPELSEQGRDYLERMQHAASRMRTLITDLLTFSRLTTKAQPFVRVDLAQVAADVLADLDERIHRTGGRVEVGDLPTVNADPIQMHRLLQNLIGNSLKFHRTEEPPVVKVFGKIFTDAELAGRLESESPRLCQITVQDNGIGFEEIYKERIFEIFQRLHGRSEYEGTGMGLAICRKIVERHGGCITAQSSLGQGATFVVTLPVRQSEEMPHEKVSQTDHHFDGRR
ncbi:MAG TPA: ATP-binding protein [Gemmataceae bacterium]|nr:ATP-binding protein [Gemmataceae bacterium]